MLTQKQIFDYISQENDIPTEHLSVHRELSSTNSYLFEKIIDGHFVNGMFCIAEQQSQGRGRLSRVWYSPPGVNIYLSMMYQFGGKLQVLTHLSLVVAILLANTIEYLGVPTGFISIKWPNDLYLKGKKCAGVLIEQTDGKFVIGIGLNVLACTNIPPDLATISTNIEQCLGKRLDRNYVAAVLIEHLLSGLKKYAVDGFSAFMTQWQRFDYLKGKTITIQNNCHEVMGTYLGIDAAGALRLAVGSETKVFYSGDIKIVSAI